MGAQELWTNNSSRDGDKSMNLGLFLEVELTESVVRLDVNLGRKKRKNHSWILTWAARWIVIFIL